MWSFWMAANLCRLFLSFVCISFKVGEGRGEGFGIPLTNLTRYIFMPVQIRIANVICRGLSYVPWVEVTGNCSLCWLSYVPWVEVTDNCSLCWLSYVPWVEVTGNCSLCWLSYVPWVEVTGNCSVCWLSYVPWVEVTGNFVVMTFICSMSWDHR